MDEATQVMMSDPTIHPMQKVTMGYNMARLREATGMQLGACRLSCSHSALQHMMHFGQDMPLQVLTVCGTSRWRLSCGPAAWSSAGGPLRCKRVLGTS